MDEFLVLGAVAVQEETSLTPTILVGGFTPHGVVVGIVVERLARNLGRITCEPQKAWEPEILPAQKAGPFGREPTVYPDRPPGLLGLRSLQH